MSSYARAEREALADLFLQLGPQAPTIDEGWVAADLAAHLVVRERRPDAAVGMYVPRLGGGYTASVFAALKARPWPDLVADVRTPPSWSPLALGPVHEAVNAQEYTIHHEDLRRAQPGWQPRRLAPAHQEYLWTSLKRARRLLYRKASVGVRLRTPVGEEVEAAQGSPVVVLVGEPLELLLQASGRGAHARVTALGDPQAVTALDPTLRPEPS